MRYVLYNKKKDKYFKEYQANRPIWTDSFLQAAQYYTMLALRMQRRLNCQSQETKLLLAHYAGLLLKENP